MRLLPWMVLGWLLGTLAAPVPEPPPRRRMPTLWDRCWHSSDTVH